MDFQGGYHLYSYDTEGNIERMYNKLDGLSGRTITYQYNRLGELTGIELSPDEHFWAYDYHPNGNVTTIGGDYNITGTTYGVIGK